MLLSGDEMMIADENNDVKQDVPLVRKSVGFKAVDDNATKIQEETSKRDE